jgi:hypothetical protein
MAPPRQPSLPPLERLPAPRGPKKPGWLKRVAAGLAGGAFIAGSLGGVLRSMGHGANRFGSFRAFALLLPAVLLLRYAWTGRFKL